MRHAEPDPSLSDAAATPKVVADDGSVDTAAHGGLVSATGDDSAAASRRAQIFAIGVVAVAALAIAWFWLLQPVPADPFAGEAGWFSAARWWHPRETNPIARVPGAERLALHAVAFSAEDPRLGWAVGDAGLILRSTDGGASWAQVPGTLGLPVASDQVAVLPAVESSRMQAGPQPAIAKGGYRDPPVQKVAGDMPGGAAGETAQVYPSPGGSGPLSRRPALRTVAAWRSTVLAAGDAGTWVGSRDGGVTWSSGRFSLKEPFHTVLLQDRTSWLVSVSAALVRSGDGDWERCDFGPLPLRPLRMYRGMAWMIGRDGIEGIAAEGPGVREVLGAPGIGEPGVTDFQFGGDGTLVVADKRGRLQMWSPGTGAGWVAVTAEGDGVLRAITFADRQRGWAVGRGGLILATRDGGRTWERQTSGTTADLAGVAFTTATEGVAVGGGLTLLRTTDGGENWMRVRLAYVREAAPLYHVVFAVATIAAASALVLRARARRSALAAAEQKSVANMLISDRPLRTGEKDFLDFAPLAEALAAYLRNSRTSAPLTLAISGPWGSGKSSLMGMLRAALERGGCPTVWFNAWHHQQEEQLLAALVENIRSQVVLPWWTPLGLEYRLKLVLPRLRRQWLRGMWVVFLFAAGVGLVAGGGGLESIQEFVASGTLPEGSPLLGKGTGLLALALAAWRALGLLRSFGVNPGDLLATGSGSARLQDLAAQTSFRYRFAQELREVTTALAPRRLVIFVDDLDRCQSQHVMEVLELVNYLASSGDVYQVLAIEQKVVTGCVAHSLGSRFELENGETVDAGTSAHMRWAYAQRWLEKLIQLVVTVPGLTQPRLAGLLGVLPEGATPAEASEMRSPVVPSDRGRPVWRGLPWGWVAAAVMGVALAAGGLALGGVLGAQLKRPGAARSQEESQAAAVTHRIEGTILGVSVKLEVREAPPAPVRSPAVVPDDRSRPGVAAAGIEGSSVADAPPEPPSPPEAFARQDHAKWWAHLAFVGVVAGGILWRTWRVRELKAVRGTSDSGSFAQALERWLPRLARHLETPRAAKLFINRVRFYAMLGRVHGAGAGDGASEAAGDESLYVTFGALEILQSAEPGQPVLSEELQTDVQRCDAAMRARGSALARVAEFSRAVEFRKPGDTALEEAPPAPS